MARTKEQIISDMVDAGMSDDEIRSAFRKTSSSETPANTAPKQPTPGPVPLSGPGASPSTTRSLAERGSSVVMDTLRKFSTPGGMFKTVADPLTTPLKSGGRIVRDNPEGAIEAIPAATVGVASVPLIASGVGAPLAALGLGAVGAAGEYARQGMRGSRGLPPTVPNRHPVVAKLLGGEGVLSRIPEKPRAMVEEAGASALPEVLGPIFSAGASTVMKAGQGLKNAAIGLAKRTQGIQKSQLYASKSWAETMRKIEQTDRAAEEALTRGDLPWTGGSEEMAKRSLSLMQEGSTKVGNAMKAAETSGVHIGAPEFASDMVKTLNPRLPAEVAATKKIVDDLESLSTVYGTISPADVNMLRQYWGKLGWRDKTVNSVDADVYRAAWKQASDSLKGIFDEISPEVAATYREGMRQEEMANVALGGITNRMAAEEGNAFLSLPGLGTKIQKRSFAPISRVLYGAGKVVAGAGAKAMRTSPLVPSIFRAATYPKEKNRG